MAKVRVYELAKEFGVESKAVMAKLEEMGEFVRSASSTIEAPVVRRLKEAFNGGGAKGGGAATRESGGRDQGRREQGGFGDRPRGDQAGARTCIPAWRASNWRSGVGCSLALCAFRVRLTPHRWLRTFPVPTPGRNMTDGDSARKVWGGTVKSTGSTLDMTETCTESRSRS